MQFDIKFDDGMPISRKDAAQLLAILQGCQQGRNWKKGDLMLVNNITKLHGKTSHVGKREILVAMAGSAEEEKINPCNGTFTHKSWQVWSLL